MTRLKYRPGTLEQRDVREVFLYKPSPVFPRVWVYFHGSLIPELVPTDELEIVA